MACKPVGYYYFRYTKTVGVIMFMENYKSLMYLGYTICRSKACIIADFGCGEARLSKSVSNLVHSFDFVAANERVTNLVN